MIEFTVKVTRYYEGRLHRCYDGFFFSKVYAIKKNEFLVYDPGDDNNDAGFRWVDFTQKMLPIGVHPKRIDCSDYDGIYSPCVELAEE